MRVVFTNTHMKPSDLRRKYIDFFVQKHDHKEITGSSLIPENDPTVLFTTAGMHPLVPYLMGESHPSGKRLVNCQKCLRTDDIDEVGDDTHCTFFEMLGNWSLGDYFKEEAIRMSYEFLTDPDVGLGLDPAKLAVSCFEGDSDAPKDEESAAVWRELGMEKVWFYGKEENWWGPAGQTGPCGPDTEMFVQVREETCGKCEKMGPACDCGRYVEIWNDVFMQYNKTAEGKYEPLEQQNVDTGMGFERVLAFLNGASTHYETELFLPVIEFLREKGSGRDVEAERVIADHLRAAVFILGDPRGVTPSNTDQGYVLRRLIRRAIRFMRKIGVQESVCEVARKFFEVYEELKESEDHILVALEKEEAQFCRTLAQGEREFEKILPKLRENKVTVVSGRLAFKLYDTYGFPLEMTKDLARENELTVDEEGFCKAFEKHQKLSRCGAEQKFKGGLQDDSEATTALHTATHLLLAALREVLGDHVYQKGSNITAERLRFDFSHPEKMTPEEKEAVEKLVNEWIEADLEVSCEEMTPGKAQERGAIGVFGERYGDKVKVYVIEGASDEICGGPHVERTSELGKFRIKKEQSSSAGVRRIKAVLE